MPESRSLSRLSSPVLVRVAPELLEQIATKDTEPVVIVGIDRQDDGTYDMVLRTPYLAERDRFRSELWEAHTWLLAAGMCDCEDRGYEGKVRCRFAEALNL